MEPEKWLTEFKKCPSTVANRKRHDGAMKYQKWLSHFSKND
jgi:hypothetical protein